MDEIALDGNIYLVGTVTTEESVDYHEWHGVMVKHDTYVQTVEIESVWVEVAGSDIDITASLSDDQLEKLRQQWEDTLS